MPSTTATHPTPSAPDIREILKTIEADTPRLHDAARVAALLSVSGSLTLPFQILKVPQGRLTALHDAARALCDAGDFAAALPICVHLSALDPTRTAYTFLAASCLQRTGRFAEALAVYQCAWPRCKTAASTFRAGECLHAMGRFRDAWSAFSESLELAKKEASNRIARLAAAAIEALRAQIALTSSIT